MKEDAAKQHPVASNDAEHLQMNQDDAEQFFISASDRFGMGKVLTFGAFLQCLGYAALLSPPPFAMFPVVYALLIGFGLALMMVSRTCILKGAQLTDENRHKQAHT